MAALTQKQKIERQQLESLRASMDSRAHDLKSLTEVLASCYTFTGIDPVHHIKEAMRHYLLQETNAEWAAESLDNSGQAKALSQEMKKGVPS